MTVIEIRPHRWGWKVLEASGVAPDEPDYTHRQLQTYVDAVATLPRVDAD